MLIGALAAVPLVSIRTLAMKNYKETQDALKILADPNASEEEWIQASILVPEQKSLPAKPDRSLLNWLAAVGDSAVSSLAGCLIIWFVQFPILMMTGCPPYVIFDNSSAGYIYPIMAMSAIPAIFGLNFGIWSQRNNAGRGWFLPTIALVGIGSAFASRFFHIPFNFWGPMFLALFVISFKIGQQSFLRFKPYLNPWTTVGSVLSPLVILTLVAIALFSSNWFSPFILYGMVGAIGVMIVLRHCFNAVRDNRPSSALTTTTISLLPTLPISYGIVATLVVDIVASLCACAVSLDLAEVVRLITPCIVSSAGVLLLINFVSLEGGWFGRRHSDKLRSLQLREANIEVLSDSS